MKRSRARSVCLVSVVSARGARLELAAGVDRGADLRQGAGQLDARPAWSSPRSAARPSVSEPLLARRDERLAPLDDQVEGQDRQLVPLGDQHLQPVGEPAAAPPAAG